MTEPNQPSPQPSAQPTTPPQISPDGQWRWDGTQWVPNTSYPSAPTYPTQPGYGPPAGYAPPPGYGAPPAYYPPAATGTDGKAIGSLVASILGLFSCGLGAIAGIVLGHLSRSEARKQGREPSGLALAGLIIGYLVVVGSLFFFAIFGLGTWVKGSFKDTETTFCDSNSSASCP